LRFTRTTKSECLAQVVFPDQKITKDLPLNTPVEIPIKADKEGKIPFQCGMAMVKGSIHVTGS
jgi:plastocyanin domain-containing protein